MSFFTVGWQPPANVGLLPQHAGDGTDPFFVVGWTPKQSATYYPYAGRGLNVTPGVPDAPESQTPAGAVPAAIVSAPVVPALPATIRPHTAKAVLMQRKNPVLFRKHGLTFAIELSAPATVIAVLVTSKGRKKLTFTQSRSVKAGTAHITLRASQYGRLMSMHHDHTAARLEVTIHYTDGLKRTLVRSVVLAAQAEGAAPPG
jgi:hypothetical protein